MKSYNLNLKGGKHPDMLLVARKRLALDIEKKQKQVKKVTLAIRRSNKSSLRLLKRHSQSEFEERPHEGRSMQKSSPETRPAAKTKRRKVAGSPEVAAIFQNDTLCRTFLNCNR